MGITLQRNIPERFFWILLVIVVLIFISGLSLFRDMGSTDNQEISFRDSILFVGDVMLARRVETYMVERGYDYPFKRIQKTLDAYDTVVGNLEVSIPEKHVSTPELTFRFSIPETFASQLARSGFTVLSLANNHTLDYGEEGLANTRAILRHSGIVSIGHPTRVTNKSVTFLDTEKGNISIIALHTTWDVPLESTLSSVFAYAKEHSDLQIVTVHWGEEYVLEGNDSQRNLAHALIDYGADLVIGHHPHVVQHIEQYNGVPIFYSLGNFIFDQYWNEEVQEGLAVGMRIDESSVHYELIPVTSIDRRSSPRPMNRLERTLFLRVLAKRSTKDLTSDIQNGMIEVSLPTHMALSRK